MSEETHEIQDILPSLGKRALNQNISNMRPTGDLNIIRQ
jgi:hypothetical protein